ncbi:MAG: hypothetical protein LAT84_04895 [Balneolia bacterium]|nr:hypothetical protein [Balneolia bacterium]
MKIVDYNLSHSILFLPLVLVFLITACTDSVTDAEPEPEPEFIIGDPEPDSEFFEVFDLENLEHSLELVEEDDEFRHYQSQIDLTADGETNLVLDLTVQGFYEDGTRFSVFFFTGVNGTEIPVYRDSDYGLREDLDYFGNAPYLRLMVSGLGLLAGEGALEERGASGWTDTTKLLGGMQSRNWSSYMPLIGGTPSYIPFRMGNRYGWAEILIFYDLNTETGDLPEYRVKRAVMQR